MTDFSELIDSSFKKLHKDMIDGLLASTAMTVECTLKFENTKFTDCPNCLFNSMTGKSANQYEPGGPIPFYHGACPYCNGRGRVPVTSTETVHLLPIWTSKDWYPLNQNGVNMADISVQTLSKITTHSSLVRCSSIIIDTSVTNYGVPEFTRLGRPEICGLGQSSHILTAWKRQ